MPCYINVPTLNHKLQGRIIVAVKIRCSARKDCAVFPLGRMDAQLWRHSFLVLKLPSTVSALWKRKWVIFLKTMEWKVKLQQLYNTLSHSNIFFSNLYHSGIVAWGLCGLIYKTRICNLTPKYAIHIQTKNLFTFKIKFSNINRRC